MIINHLICLFFSGELYYRIYCAMDDSNLQETSMVGTSKGDEEKEENRADVCHIGQADKSECHLPSVYRGESVIKSICSLPADQQILLSRRTGLEFDDLSTICSYHQAIFLTSYELFQKKCCNPFSKENHNSMKRLRTIDIAIADQVNTVTKRKDTKPGQKLCTRCISDLSAALRAKEQSDSCSDFEDTMDTNEKVNASLTSLDISPLKFSAVSQRDSATYAKRKVNEAHNALVCKIACAGGLNEEKLAGCDLCKDYKLLIDELKEKLRLSSHAQKIQILTLAPDSWAKEKIVEEFGVTDYMVRQARKLKKTAGVLALPTGKVGKKLSEQVTQRVEALYEDDEFSRQCPGKKDFVSVRINGEKVHKQKRLLLCNLRELFAAYRLKNGLEIGFSKFCELRPKWCMTVGAAGSHSVCVCTMHQNIKLMLFSSPVSLDYKALMEKMVCDIESKECMLHRCEDCAGKEGILEYMTNAFCELDPDESVEFKQWVHTDRDTIETRQLPLDEFISELSEKIFNLTSHHYTAKHQSAYLRLSKEGLTKEKLVILMDFAENYSFVVQDAIQSFHWENSQATMHPFVVYYTDSDQQIANLSFCIVSDSLKHDTIAVHVFLTRLLWHLQQKFPEVKHIQYFSDGSAAQYKNFKNFINLCYHEQDFGLSAEWNFFATSHGKSPCDGIGGTAKRLAAHASLQRPLDNQILTPADLFAFCKENVQGINFLFVTKEEIETTRLLQEKRFEKGQTVAGTRENHQFRPVTQSSINVSRVSDDPISFIANLFEPEMQSPGLKVAELQPGQFIACMYDNKWWIGNINSIALQEHDALIDFMHPHGPATSFYWPSRKDTCWVPEQHLVAILPAPSISSTGRSYNYPDVIITNIEQLFGLIKQ